MKSLVFILAIGLLLPSFGGSVKPDRINEKFTNLCGYDYLQKVFEICGSAPWTIPRLYPTDLAYVSDYNVYFKETNMKKVKRMYDNDWIQQPDLYYDTSKYEQRLEKFDQYASEIEGDDTMLITLSYSVLDEKLPEKCCKRSCTKRELRQFCRP